jgi:hypothetical protein
VLAEALIARRVLAEVLHVERYGGGISAVLPSAVLLAVVTACSACSARSPSASSVSSPN